LLPRLVFFNVLYSVEINMQKTGQGTRHMAVPFLYILNRIT
jgi:hypothetical protein